VFDILLPEADMQCYSQSIRFHSAPADTLPPYLHKSLLDVVDLIPVIQPKFIEHREDFGKEITASRRGVLLCDHSGKVDTSISLETPSLTVKTCKHAQDNQHKTIDGKIEAAASHTTTQ